MTDPAYAYGRFLGQIQVGAQALLDSLAAGFRSVTDEAARAQQEVLERAAADAAGRARRARLAAFEASDPEARLEALALRTAIEAAAIRSRLR